MEFEFNDGRLSGGRYPILWIIHKGIIHTFKGESIPQVVTILSCQYQKNGKWSNTTYQLKTGTGIPVRLCAPLHGKTWPEASLEEAYRKYEEIYKNVSLEEYEKALRRDYPTTLERMKKVKDEAQELT